MGFVDDVEKFHRRYQAAITRRHGLNIIMPSRRMPMTDNISKLEQHVEIEKWESNEINYRHHHSQLKVLVVASRVAINSQICT
jgi:hypothetical protein